MRAGFLEVARERVLAAAEKLERARALLREHFEEAGISVTETALAWFAECVRREQPDAVLITGDLTMNGVTKPVVLDAEMTQIGEHPMAKKPWVGFKATTSVIRSEYNLGMFAPYVGDEVNIAISIEATKAE